MSTPVTHPFDLMFESIDGAFKSYLGRCDQNQFYVFS